MSRKVKVHFGCGHHKIEGWINIDIEKSCNPDVVADLTQTLPFKAHSVDYIHSEDFLDQIEMREAYSFLQECFRILKRDGVMRLLTPNLYELTRRYLKGDETLIPLWNREVGIPLRTNTLCEVFNLGLRLLGHRFLYDGPTLTLILRECGFERKVVGYQMSQEPELRGLDLRSPQTGISLYFDCYKGRIIKESDSPLFKFPFGRLKKLLRG